jgi:hypothetical protein
LNEIISGPTGCSSVYIDFYDGTNTYNPININNGVINHGSVMYSIIGATFSNQTTSVSDFVDLSSYTGSTGLKCNIYQINNNYDSNPVSITSYRMALRMTQQQ